ncbi:hypothetical protein BJ508DRAFT_417582 [Ascobolus immersus RN42]|uniref:ABC transporter domain-containing protein n=1 Tax=Ascobolus immersus RN42 TaxID=1160509 RepID=A0A3N4I3K6_ASCIM|nr:hypothetical protein BJ508DRAFT_417582 [Ascobolus immersus RN42]
MAALSTLRQPWVSRLFQTAQSFITGRKKKRNQTLIAALLVLCLSGGAEVLRRRRIRNKVEQGRARLLVRRNSGIQLQDGVKQVYVPSSATDGAVSKVTIYPTKETTFQAHRRLFLSTPVPTTTRKGGASSVPPPKVKPGINLAFLHQFLSLWSIMVPRVTSKETGLLFLHTVFLVLRTYLSLVIARLDGVIVRDLVSGNGKGFLKGLLKWVAVGIPGVYSNAMIKFLQAKLSIAFRTRLTRYVHDLYLNDDLGYYKLQNLDGGLVGGGADQFITTDIPHFCDSASALYSSLGKPFLDLIVFNYQLYVALGPLAFSAITANYIGTAWILKKLSPPFGKLVEAIGRAEGGYRSSHSRLISNAEEIAFYGGSDMEKTILERGFADLKALMEGVYKLKVKYNMLEDFILKYSWSAFGYLVTSLPVFLPAWGGLGGMLELAAHTATDKALSDNDNAISALSATLNHERQRDRMKAFITNKRLMLSLADAGGRMMYSLKDLSELAGYTSRVYSLISTLHRVHSNTYTRPHPELYSLADVQGGTYRGFDGLRFESVPIVAPALYPQGGEELISALTFELHAGEHLLISGPNGVGKTSVARIVAGLWPVYRGLVSRPRLLGGGESGIMVLSQRPYLSHGNLRDQVIYPHTEFEMKAAGKTDSDLSRILESVRLGYLEAREGGFDVRKEWKDVLSGGEKQRMIIARLLYHDPKYAVLDEPTSAVSTDVEGLLYETAKQQGITIITISSRAQLKRYHTFQLELGVDGRGWEFDRIGGDRERVGVRKELEELRRKVERVEGLKKRLVDVKQELGEAGLVGKSITAN